MTSEVTAAMRLIRVAAENPEAEFEALLQKTQSEADRELLLAVDFDFCEYWREEKNTVALTALFYVRGDSVSIAVLRTALFDQCKKMRGHSLSDLLHELPVTIFPLNGPMQLQPIAIPKPWGQEIWYTGIEKRGVAEIGEAGRSVPLPWLLAVAPQRLLRGAQQPILLKILDPLPEPVFGDLYFELHRQKQEVYVVTAVDRSAWPDGVGAIRFGFDANRRHEFANDAEFVEAYLSAVRDYRVVRKQIDAQIDRFRHRENIGLNEPVSAATLARWLEEIDSELQKNEATLRTRMESFTALMPLRIGDVVKVPCLLPHSLQHGVRTVEFQTPVYERLILSFAQKVLTQTEWDTDEAAAVLQLDPEPPSKFPLLAQGEGWLVEQIVQFDDFEVRRISLQPQAQMQLGHDHGYALGMVVGQVLELGGKPFDPDEAVLLPTHFGPLTLRNNSDLAAYFLLALPLA
ncbi:MAG: hypothetical protein QM709_13755 [Spongiibacteraceae bacterium]